MKRVTSRGTFALRCEGAALQSAGCLGKYRPTLFCRAGTCPPYLAAPALQRTTSGPKHRSTNPPYAWPLPTHIQTRTRGRCLTVSRFSVLSLLAPVIFWALPRLPCYLLRASLDDGFYPRHPTVPPNRYTLQLAPRDFTAGRRRDEPALLASTSR